MNQHYTSKTYARLEEQIEEAQAAYDAAMLSMGSDAADGNNTWHDNPAFEEAKNRVDQTRNEVARLKRLRDDAVVVETVHSGSVEVGSTVTIQIGDDTPFKVFVGGHYVPRGGSTDEVTEVSTSSPIGAAILGHIPGDIIDYSTPSGGRKQVTVIDVELE